ncbi:MAG: MTH1187 family thiamine-binding protein [Planctomycetaceae bacterium]|nr:MTH1187 family thiamine-binding protein [Planctomycetaceae bacterium]
MVLLEFSITPLEKGASVSRYVARSLEIIDASGLDYRLHAMGTVVEGELDDCLALLKKCIEAMAADCERISCTAKFDYRRGYSGRLDSKVTSVEEKLGRKLKTIGGMRNTSKGKRARRAR